MLSRAQFALAKRQRRLMQPVIQSLRETDLYKFTMWQTMLRRHSQMQAEYTFVCRNQSCAPQIFHPARPRGNFRRLWHHERMVSLLRIAGLLVEDAFRWVLLLFRPAEVLRAENLFLRRQLALYIERGVQPHRVDAATGVSLALLAGLF